MAAITEICAREILDSRGNPTVEVEVALEDGSRGVASAPSGASCGSLEAFELRDNDKSRFHGKGVMLAVNNVNNIIYRTLNGMESTDQAIIDQYLIDLDGTKNKSNLGANAIIATSLAIAKASAISLNMPLYQYIGGVMGNTMPVPMANIINGGAHADNNIDIQEFMIMPFTAKTIRDAVRICSEIFHKLKEILKKEGHNVNVGDEGGFAPNLDSTKAALRFIMMAISECGYKPGVDVMLALDAASTEFYKDEKYHLKGENKILSYKELTDYYLELANNYPIFSIEDAMSEADYEGWQHITEKMGDNVQLVGDDLFVTNKVELQKGINNKMANAVLIKPNQIGTLTETIATISLAKSASYNVIISHRSGETEDTTLAHIAVGTNAGQIKTGSLSRTDRIAKYNELMRIEDKAGFAYKKLGKSLSVND